MRPLCLRWAYTTTHNLPHLNLSPLYFLGWCYSSFSWMQTGHWHKINLGLTSFSKQVRLIFLVTGMQAFVPSTSNHVAQSRCQLRLYQHFEFLCSFLPCPSLLSGHYAAIYANMSLNHPPLPFLQWTSIMLYHSHHRDQWSIIASLTAFTSGRLFLFLVTDV